MADPKNPTRDKSDGVRELDERQLDQASGGATPLKDPIRKPAPHEPTNG